MHIAGKIFIGLGLLITLAGVGLVIGGGSNLSDVGQWDVEEKSQFEGTEGSMTYQFSGDDMMIMVRDDVVCKEFEFEMTKGAAAALAVNYTDNETTLILNDASSFPNEGSGSIWDEEGQNNKLVPLGEIERNLVMGLGNIEFFLDLSLKNSEPHHLANYLYDISNLFNSFYQDSNIKKIEDEAERSQKILITTLFIQYSHLVMSCLGIKPVEKM